MDFLVHMHDGPGDGVRPIYSDVDMRFFSPVAAKDGWRGVDLITPGIFHGRRPVHGLIFEMARIPVHRGPLNRTVGVERRQGLLETLADGHAAARLVHPSQGAGSVQDLYLLAVARKVEVHVRVAFKRR